MGTLERIGMWLEIHGDQGAFIASILGIVFVFIGMGTGAFE